jgi:hypothetical protein
LVEHRLLADRVLVSTSDKACNLTSKGEAAAKEFEDIFAQINKTATAIKPKESENAFLKRHETQLEGTNFTVFSVYYRRGIWITA